ncbi:MAG: Ig-like domain-containing protein [Deltaproteobacteria bacterium]|nr:Ig-like domain-containing protein [Deltaproteobacteria bacterium]
MIGRGWIIGVLVAVAMIAACAQDMEYEKKESSVFELHATIPADGTGGVALATNVIFHFNRPIDLAALSGMEAELFRIEPGGERIAVPARLGATGDNLLLMPLERLMPNSTYEAVVHDTVRDSEGAAPELDGRTSHAVAFSTRGERTLAGATMSVTTLVPDPSEEVYDWSTFHVYFSEPVDPTLRYGANIAIRRVGSTTPIPADLFVAGGLVAIDPTSDLEPGRQYELFIAGALRDAGGEPIGEDITYVFDIRDSTPRATLVVEQCPTMSNASSCEPVTDVAKLDSSNYTGEPVNSMVINSTLLGRTQAFLGGQLRVEMGNTAANTSSVPVVIRRGQKLHASSLEALFGGRIPSGLATGDITLTVLTDAFGFMQSPDQTYGIRGGKVGLKFTLDAAINTDNSTANAQMGQALLGLRLVGHAETVDNGVLSMEVATYETVDIFGESMDVTVSLGLRPPQGAYQSDGDSTAPGVESSSPRPYAESVRLGDPIRIYFNEPIRSSSSTPISLWSAASQTGVAGRISINGPKLTFEPNWPLTPLTEYEVRLDTSISDLAGNTSIEPIRWRFTTGAAEATQVPPQLGTSDPGLNSLVAHPAHLPVQIWFTQIMDPASLSLGDTVFVTDLTAGGPVEGTLDANWTSIVFTPNEPFDPEHTYQWRVTDGAMNIAGIALDVDGDGLPGGSIADSSVATTFRAVRDDDVVKLIFELNPAADSDTSGYVDGAETATDVNYFAINLFGLFGTPSYATGFMVGHVRPLDTNDDDAALPIALVDGTRIFSTNTGIDLGKAFGRADYGPLDTGPIRIDAATQGSADVSTGVDGLPEMAVDLPTQFAVSNPLFAGLIVPEVDFKATGAVAFSTDGRIIADIRGTTSIRLNIPLTSWEIPLPASINLQAVSPAP